MIAIMSTAYFFTPEVFNGGAALEVAKNHHIFWADPPQSSTRVDIGHSDNATRIETSNLLDLEVTVTIV